MRKSMRIARRAGLAAAAVVISSSLVGSPLAAAESTPTTAGDAKSQIEKLQKEQRDIEGQYQKENEKLQRLMGQNESKRADIAIVEAKIETLKNDVGSVALAQYKSGGTNQTAQLITTGDTGKFLTGLGQADKLGESLNDQLKTLQAEQASLTEMQRTLQADQAASKASRDKLATLDKQAKDKVNSAQALYDKLSAEEKKKLDEAAAARVASGSPTTPSTAPANGQTSYPNPGQSYLGGSTYSQPAITPAGNFYDWGNCTYWVYIRREQVGRPIGSVWGNAAQWPGSASAAGFTVDNTPEPGAAYVTFGGYYGHVMFVEQVNGDGTMLISEMNWNWMTGVTTYRTIPAVGTFIH